MALALLMRNLTPIAIACFLWLPLFAQQEPAALERLPEAQGFFIHEFHATQLELDCSVCHVPSEEGSVELARPGHDQCILCHEANYEEDLTPVFCGQCHADFPPLGTDELLPFPFYRKTRAILFDFAHSKHIDPERRANANTGFRADCTFCHQFDDEGIYAKFPTHKQCTACHSNPDIQPNLVSESDTPDCRGCHVPEEIENPGYVKERQLIAEHVVSGVYVNLRFSHIAHFKKRDEYKLDCVSCHYAVETSTSLADLTLPKMLDCVECHDVDKGLAETYQMSNCSNCHIDVQTGPVPASHSRSVKPAFHNESFRVDHTEQAEALGAKCYVCHLNVTPSASATDQCASCHQATRPLNHTARWRDDLHGKIAAMDRTSCATCHVADTCVRCHNQLPRSHQPLSQFVGGGHASLAVLEQRACFTCHQFENSCAKCHVR
jgi:hypothetical protein